MTDILKKALVAAALPAIMASCFLGAASEKTNFMHDNLNRQSSKVSSFTFNICPSWEAPRNDEELVIPESEKTAAGADDVPFATWSDFAGLRVKDGEGSYVRPDNSCSPIAATNVLKYFLRQRMISFNGKITDSNIFTVMFYEMDTNQVRKGGSGTKPGTDVDNIESGFVRACRSFTTIAPKTEVLRSNKGIERSVIEKYIDDGYLLIASVLNYRGHGRHTVTLYGYSDGGYIFADGIRSGRVEADIDIYHIVAIKL